MAEPPLTIGDLSRELYDFNGQSYRAYQALLKKAYAAEGYLIRFIHIQGSPGAFPASMVHLVMDHTSMGLDRAYLSTATRRMATADYLLRIFGEAVRNHAHQNRGAQGSGSFQPLELPPQVLQRNLVQFEGHMVRIGFYISLPGTTDNNVLSTEAVQMFEKELPAIVAKLKTEVASGEALLRHCNVVEDMMDLQARLSQYNLVAFVGDGSNLPRHSGTSQTPLKAGAIEFKAPDDLAVEVRFPHAGRVRGSRRPARCSPRSPSVPPGR